MMECSHPSRVEETLLANLFMTMKKIIALIVTFFLGGCSTFFHPPALYPNKPVSHYLAWTQRKTQLNGVTDWQANGNIAIHAKKGSGANASFSWQQIKANYQLHLFGPFGTQSVLLSGSPQRVTLIAHNQTTSAQNAERLLEQQLGLHLPVSQLYYWLRGLPAPQLRYTASLDAYNRLLKLRQSGWRIDYLQYTNSGKLDIPERIELSNAYWTVRIAITRWEFN
jgi:outer membrane lipoprotein LolB